MRARQLNTAVTWPCSAPVRTSEPSPRAPSAQRKRIEKDGFAAPVSPCQDAEAAADFEIEPVDQDDVTDRQRNQHRRISGLARRSA